MRHLFKILASIALISLMTGCTGSRVYIDVNEVGVISGSHGIQGKILKPGSLKLDSCGVGACPKLIKLPVNKFSKDLPGKYLMSKSLDQTLTLDLSLTVRVKHNEDAYRQAFKIKPDIQEGVVRIITEERLYETFVYPVVRDTTRQALNHYSIQDVMDNQDSVRQFIQDSLNKVLEKTPMEVVRVSFNDVEYPETVTKAKEEFARIEIEKATDMKEMAAELEIREKKLELEISRVKMFAEVTEIASKRLGLSAREYLMLTAINTSAEEGTPWALNMDTVYRKVEK